jgi:transposase-like protein
MKKKALKLINPAPEFRKQRVFSEALKRKIVSDFNSKLHTVSEIGKLYDVSTTSVYRWIYRFTPGLAPGIKQVVQMESEAEKSRKLTEQVGELERALGRNQMKVEFLEKILDLGSAHLGFDLKKTFGTTPLNGSDSTENSTENV